jgi:circadian clock protein KaiC
MHRVKTGIDGLDKLIEGGIPKGSFVVVTGGPGTGKTILGSQFLAKGVTDFNEKGLFISVEQPKEEIISQASQFGWDFNEMESRGMLRVVTFNAEELFEMNKLKELRQLLHDDHYDRIVIDSISSFIYSPISHNLIANGLEKGFQPGTFMELGRANAALIVDLVKYRGITTLGLAQKIEGMPGETIDTVSEFKGDGLIVMSYATIGRTFNRTIQVKKLRKTKIDGIPYNFDFTEQGISLKV